MKLRWLTAVLQLVLAATVLAATDGEDGTRLLRYPDIHGDRLVFCHGGDLWLASTEGGMARRLTAHPGQELFPRFSPDGQWIAFTGQYDGDEQVYVIPADGGEPTRLTWYPAVGPLPARWGYDNQVYGWTRDGEAVLFRSYRDAGYRGANSRLYTVPRSGGLPEALPMPDSGAGDFAPDGGRLVYSPLFRDFRHWKRYQGGWAQDLYLFDLATHAVQQIAHSPRTERDPMWIGDKIYFVSDRDDRLNLYAVDPVSGEVEQLTRHDPWDVRWPSTDHNSRIVYELDGRLRIFDVLSGEDRELQIRVPDDGLWKRARHISVAEQVSDFALSPEGKRALFVARGEVFSVPIEKGPVRNLSESSNANDRDARWSPDGRHVAYISDADGEDEVWIVDQAGTKPARQLSDGHSTRLSGLVWSPDSKRIAVTDVQGRLLVISVDDGSEVTVAEDSYGFIGTVAWSPHGGHLAFCLRNEEGVRRLHVWSVADGRLRQVTSDLFRVEDPAWGPDGDYLFFVSARHYAPQVSNLEWNYAGNERDGIFALALRRDVKPILPPQSDEVELDQKQEAKDKTKDKPKDEPKDKSKGEAPIVIDFDGLGERVMRIPVEPGNYWFLDAVQGHLVYGNAKPFFFGRDMSNRLSLHRFSLEDRKAKELATGVLGAALSNDGSKVLIRDAEGYKLLPVKDEDEEKGGTKQVSVAGLAMDLDPVQEWRQIFDEAWRLFRDFFYAENMNGYDWQALGDRYRAQLPHVTHRADLNYVLTEMVAELNTGHTYISGGDYEVPERAPVGLPGARFELDRGAGRYRIARIMPGHNEEERYRSPLTEVGVDAREGDYVLAINGRDLAGTDNPYRLLRNLSDPVSLTVNDSPTAEGARAVSYVPLRSEASLLYLEWVLGNLERVTKLSDGRVGYLHIPDMGPDGIAEFIKWFYPQIRKQGLVVDARGNGGGSVSQWILERLDTKVLGTGFSRTADVTETYPGTAFYGHMACLVSETSASDGDIFPYYFREAGLGPVIGKRSWGGVIGGGFIPLIDGGTAFVPTASTNDLAGEYIIEGYGVDPDIEVENDPASVIAGGDPQLERAVAELLAAIERDPRILPKRPADPVKTPAPR